MILTGSSNGDMRDIRLIFTPFQVENRGTHSIGAVQYTGTNRISFINILLPRSDQMIVGGPSEVFNKQGRSHRRP